MYHLIESTVYQQHINYQECFKKYKICCNICSIYFVLHVALFMFVGVLWYPACEDVPECVCVRDQLCDGDVVSAAAGSGRGGRGAEGVWAVPRGGLLHRTGLP